MTEHDRAAHLEAAIERDASALLAYLVRRVDIPEDAADLLAETFLAAWRSSRVPRNEAELRPWLFGVARNVLKHHYRAGTRAAAVVDRLRDQLTVTPGAGFEASDVGDRVRAAVARLPPRYQEIVTLVHWDELSLVEVSRVLRLPQGTVRSRYHRARAALRLMLDDIPAGRPC